MKSGEAKLFIGILVVALALVGVVFKVSGPAPNVEPPGPVLAPAMTESLLVPPGSHGVGDPKAPFTLVEFTDYQCPSCKAAVPDVDRFLKEHQGQLRVVYHTLQVNGSHALTPQLACGVEAAARQGKFREMYSKVFENQAKYEGMTPQAAESALAAFARELHLDLLRFQADMGSPQVRQAVANERALAERVGVHQTPTFFLIPPSKKIMQLEGPKPMRDYLSNPKTWQQSATR